MVVGASGTGRSSFVNAMCGQPILGGTVQQPDAGVQIRPASIELDDEETDSRIQLTIVDTPGFGNSLDNSPAFERILGYLETQFDEVLAEETRIRRNPRFKDNRVHACVYFIEPTGHGLRELDVEMMRVLARRVNVIPVLSRADQLTPQERILNKRLVMEDIANHEIPIFNFPFNPDDDDEETIQFNSEMRDMLPFAIVSGNELIHVDGRPVLARVYPWGYVDCENPKHSDFMALKSALLSSHLGDLKDLTHDVLYENYRTERLSRLNQNARGSRMLDPADLAQQSYVLKEEQLARESEKIREIEMRIQKEINDKRMELSLREQELREMEMRIARERSVMSATPTPDDTPQMSQGIPGAFDTPTSPDSSTARESVSHAAPAPAFAQQHHARHSSIDGALATDVSEMSIAPKLGAPAPLQLNSGANSETTPLFARNQTGADGSQSPPLPPRSPNRPQSMVIPDVAPLATNGNGNGNGGYLPGGIQGVPAVKEEQDDGAR